MSKPLVLIILDGWGLAPSGKGNAISQAKTPNFDKYWREYPHTSLEASGKYVGLPDNQIGNSEAGHMNLGAGKVITQDSCYVSCSILDGTFFRNPAFIAALKHIEALKSRLHIMSLITGDQSAHADPFHLKKILKFIKDNKVKGAVLHLFTDGRDAPSHNGLWFLKDLENFVRKEKIEVDIGTISGRYFAMDRVKKWERTEKIYNALVYGKGEKSSSARKAIKENYKKKIGDEFIEPTVIYKNGKMVPRIKSGDSIVFVNLRSDRARQLTKTFAQREFIGFKIKERLSDILFVAMTEFGPDLDTITAYPARTIKNTLPRILGKKGIKQLYITESEKYAHVTYFFNGGFADPVAHEERIKIDSPIVKSYAEKPEMSAFELTDTLVKYIKEGIYDFIVVNYANPDMVGHTGDLKAGIKACEVVDECLGKLVSSILKKKGEAVITADHGNIEEMIYPDTGDTSTTHSRNPVPFILVDSFQSVKLKKGVLANVAPTILDILHIEKPKGTEESLMV